MKIQYFSNQLATSIVRVRHPPSLCCLPRAAAGSCVEGLGWDPGLQEHPGWRSGACWAPSPGHGASQSPESRPGAESCGGRGGTSGSAVPGAAGNPGKQHTETAHAGGEHSAPASRLFTCPGGSGRRARPTRSQVHPPAPLTEWRLGRLPGAPRMPRLGAGGHGVGARRRRRQASRLPQASWRDWQSREPQPLRRRPPALVCP